MKTDEQNEINESKESLRGFKVQWAKNKYEVVAVIALVFVLVLVLFTNKPGRYKPFREKGTDLVSPYLTHQLVPEFLEKVQLEKPFEMVIGQEGVNDIVSRIGWFNDSSEVTVFAPSIVFGEGVFYIMATVEVAGVDTVVTIIAKPVIEDKKIVFNLKKVKFGSMPMTGVAKRIVRKMIDEQMGEVGEDSTQKRFWRSLLDNAPFDPTFEVYDTKIMITDVKFSEEKLVVMIVPAPEK